MREREITIIREAKAKKDEPSDGRVEKSLLSKLIDSDDLTDALDVVSAIGVGAEVLSAATGVGIPAAAAFAGVSAAADIVNSLRMAARGDLLRAAMYAAFAVPIFGDALQGTKLVGKAGERGAQAVARLVKFGKTQKAAQAAKTAYKLIDKVPGREDQKAAVKKATSVVLSGDSEAIAKLAEDSGDSDLANEIRKRFTAETDSENVSETRRRRSLISLYEGTLYK
jgi:hypothetical protein